jgi:ubiquitin-conjugating enzyme E2 D/E
MISARNNIAIKRINKDMKEITKNPIEGIGIVSLDDDPMKYIINIRLMNGPYEGYCVQLLLTFSDNYPTKPPKILIIL